MPTERIQRQIDRLLYVAEGALSIVEDGAFLGSRQRDMGNVGPDPCNCRR